MLGSENPCVLVILFLFSCWINTSRPDCDILILSPWEEKTYIPRDFASLTFICSGEEDNNLEWSVFLVGRQASSHFDFESSIKLLNDHGFYEVRRTVPVPEEELQMNNSIQLLINNTEGNNGTLVKCFDAGTSPTLHQTTIIITDLKLNVTGIHQQKSMVNISWSTQLPFDQEKVDNYHLSVISHSTQPHSVQLNTSFLVFTAPEGAPHCEVYNFSVTATYVGVTYTGASCSVTSPVVSSMLPSLPDQRILELSLNYSLEKQGTGNVILRLFTPIKYYCEEYPVVNYTVKLTDVSSSELWSLSVLAKDSITADGLLEDTVYVFELIAVNDFGAVSTDNHTIYTTDVQMVSMATQSDYYTFNIECVFISGSTAQGCMVMLLGEVDNTTVNLTRDQNARIFNSAYSISCYNTVIAFDIEQDGSIDTIPVPGDLVSSNEHVKCLPRPVNLRAHLSRILLQVTGLFILLIIGTLIMICLAATKLLRIKIKRRPDTPSLLQERDQSVGSNVPLYDLPANAVRENIGRASHTKSDNYTDYNRLTHQSSGEADIYDPDDTAYAHLQDDSEVHHYHVLECREAISRRSVGEVIAPDLDAPELPPPFNPDNTPMEQHPIYQEVTELSRDCKQHAIKNYVL